MWESWPRFAPDGRSIGFVARGGIWLLRPDRRRILLVRRGGPFAWSHDGRKLAYYAPRPRRKGRVGVCPCSDLYVREGGRARRLLAGVDPGLTWSPDDRWITVTRSEPPNSGGTSGLILVDLAGRTRTIFDDAALPDWRH